MCRDLRDVESFEGSVLNDGGQYRRRSRPRHSCVDSTFVKKVYGVDCVGRNPTDRGRMATRLTNQTVMFVTSAFALDPQIDGFR